MSNKPANGKADAGGGQAPDLGSSSVAQGLQSVMAVIGETYDTSDKSASDDLGAAQFTSAAEAPRKLTDKIDAARSQQGDSSASVAAGLQSIMAVIGETYDDNEPQTQPSSSHQPVITPPPAQPQQAASQQHAPQASDRQAAGDADDDLLADLMPLLTDEEKQIGHIHHPVIEDRETGSAPASTALATTGADDAGKQLQGLLGQLQTDISTLEQENIAQRQQYNMPAVVDNASNEVKSLLTQLQGDISALRSENDALKSRYNIPLTGPVGGQSSEVAMLLGQLQGDINSLRGENEALRTQYGIGGASAAGGGGEVGNLLSQLQGDIANLRHENESFKTQYNVATPGRSGGTSFGQAFLMSIGLLALIGAATLGGFFMANRLNNQSNENLLALMGMTQQRAARTEATQTELPKEAPKPEPKPEVEVAAAPPEPKAPPLPQVTVRKTVLESEEVQGLIREADELISLGDLVTARQVLEYAISQQSAEANYRLAQTYDPLYLKQMATVVSVDPNLTRAKIYYYSAAKQGHKDASERLSQLRSSGN